MRYKALTRRIRNVQTDVGPTEYRRCVVCGKVIPEDRTENAITCSAYCIGRKHCNQRYGRDVSDLKNHCINPKAKFFKNQPPRYGDGVKP